MENVSAQKIHGACKIWTILEEFSFDFFVVVEIVVCAPPLGCAYGF